MQYRDHSNGSCNRIFFESSAFSNTHVKPQNVQMKYIFILLLAGIVSCEPGIDQNGGIPGYAPIYATAQAAITITTEAVKPTVHPGKIYAYGNYLFQVEQNEGIHIIDNSNPQQAQKISFLKIPTCFELAIRSNYLYTNSLNDLLVFNLSNINSPQLVNRLKNAFPEFSQTYP